MKRIIISAAAFLAVIPASLGLMGNASFAQSVPVRVPAHATLVGSQREHLEIDDHKGGLSTHFEFGDDKGGLSTHAESGDDKGGLNGAHGAASHDKVSAHTSGKVDNSAKVDVKGGRDSGARHQ